MDISPLAIILVKNGSGGDKLLFKYPFALEENMGSSLKSSKRNPYSVAIGNRSVGLTQKSQVAGNSCISSTGKLSDFSDKVLSNLFTVSNKLAGSKFELKVNDIRFVGHPVNLEETKDLQDKEKRKTSSSILLFNIVFALKAAISHDIVNCYYDLSKRLGIALAFEEKRCQILSHEAKIMVAAQEENLQQPEDTQNASFKQILLKSIVANHLKQVYEDLCAHGEVNIRLNDWHDISFCLPQKINYGVGKTKRINVDVLKKGLLNVKPYHTLLLLVEKSELLQDLSLDVSPSLHRLLKVESPISPFYTLAADADLTLSHILQLAGHLVYWGKGTIIYPICNTNVYVLSQHAPTSRNNKYAEKFRKQFPGISYHTTLAEYSLPISLRDKCNPMWDPEEHNTEKLILFWMLKHGLLQQLHTYVYLCPPSSVRVRSGLSSSHPSSARGPLAPVAEVWAERHDENKSVPSSPKSEHRRQNSVDGRSPMHKSIDRTATPSFPLEDEPASNLDSSCHEALVGRKSFQSEDMYSPYSSLSSQKNFFQSNLLNFSYTPSESDFGSVCSDDRSISPSGVLNSDNSEERTYQELGILLSPDEKEMVMNTEAAKNIEDLKLFARLCHYFRGMNHMEEIMYYANLDRSQLLECLDKFRSILITVQRTDPSISFAFDM